MKLSSLILIAAVLLVTAPPAVFLYMNRIVNPRLADELRNEPNGERARKVMLLTLPSGREIPVNYLREGASIYAAADGRWWRELIGDGASVRLLVRGKPLAGHARAIRNDPAQTKTLFARLRPNALPGFGTLVEVQLNTFSTLSE